LAFPPMRTVAASATCCALLRVWNSVLLLTLAKGLPARLDVTF
jgi:hypothetical protein